MIFPRYQRIQDAFEQRPFAHPATLVQRHGAFMLDVGGLILSALIIVAVYKWAFDIPWGRPRYIPPSTEMGWSRMVRSLSSVSVLMIIAALFTSSALRGTPGMASFYLKLSDHRGHKVGFLRALGWNITAFFPLLVANYLVLAGIALERPLIHLGIVNVFNILILLQVLWFLPVFTRRDKKTVYDLLWRVRVDHFTPSSEGPTLLQKIFHFPFLVVVIVLMAGPGLWAMLNLTDQPLSPRLQAIEAYKPRNLAALRVTWRNDPGYEISMKLPDFRCASKTKRFHLYAACPSREDIRATIDTHKGLIGLYYHDVLGNARNTVNNTYLTQESIALTDLVLADLILRHERGDTKAFGTWLSFAQAWQEITTEPAFLIAKSKALIHYNHVLAALPVLAHGNLNLSPEEKQILRRALDDTVFSRIFLDRVMSYEYALYNNLLLQAQLDYFPFIQPNATRNYFITAIDAVEDLFAHQKLLYEQPDTLLPLETLYGWDSLYNPLGLRLRDLGLRNFATSLQVVSAFHQHNAYKKMLRIFLAAHEKNVPLRDMEAFMDTLEPERLMVFQNIPIQWDAERKALFYTLPGLTGFRREIPL